MGFDVTVFSVFGVRINDHDMRGISADDLELLDAVPWEQFVFIRGTDGKYVVVGKCLFDSGDVGRRILNEEYRETDIADLVENDVKMAVKAYNTALYDLIKDREFKIINFTQIM